MSMHPLKTESGLSSGPNEWQTPRKEKNGERNAPPQFRIDLELIRTKGWTKFVQCHAEATFWFLLAWIVRKNIPTGGMRLYEDFYDKGMLASRWSQEDIAEHLGLTQGTISKHITELVEIGLVKKHPKVVNGKTITIYQLGIRKPEGGEELFLEKLLREEATEDRREKARKELAEYGMNIDEEGKVVDGTMGNEDE